MGESMREMYIDGAHVHQQSTYHTFCDNLTHGKKAQKHGSYFYTIQYDNDNDSFKKFKKLNKFISTRILFELVFLHHNYYKQL